MQHLVDQRFDDMPYFRPGLLCRLTQNMGMLSIIAQARPVGVIIETDQIGSPPEEHGEFGSQHIAERRAEALRPIADIPHGSFAPIFGSDKRSHLSLPRKETIP